MLWLTQAVSACGADGALLGSTEVGCGAVGAGRAGVAVGGGGLGGAVQWQLGGLCVQRLYLEGNFKGRGTEGER